MADLPGMPASVRCEACGFENTTTSLYCQDCGARLVAPPSALVEEQEAEIPQGEAPRAVPRILSANRQNRIRHFLSVTVGTLVIAAVVALLILVLQPPRGMPADASPLAPEVLENVRTGLARIAAAEKTFQAPWNGQGVNAYLAGRLPPDGAFAGASLAPTADGFALYVRHKVIGITFCTKTAYRLVPRGNGMDIAGVSTSLGRLPLPVFAAPAIEAFGGDLTKNLGPDLAVLRQAKAVRTVPQKVFVNFGTPAP